ncbi:hypothetical protein [Prosthecobacter sp.]|uniref:hypothetical protein n=1 Tax=Prosthecobacter sp. TaxID=1965333 RepID=UPI0037839D44
MGSLLPAQFDKPRLEAIHRDYGVAESIETLTDSQGRYITFFALLDPIRDRFVAEGNGGRAKGDDGDIRRRGGDLIIVAEQLNSGSTLASAPVSGEFGLPKKDAMHLAHGDQSQMLLEQRGQALNVVVFSRTESTTSA